MKNVKKEGFSYLMIVLLGMLLAVNYSLFIVPNGFAPAGINGIAVMIQYKLGFSIGFLSLLINIPLCVFAFFAVKRSFSVRTLVFCLTYSAAYLLLQKTALLDRFSYRADNVDTIYPVILSGVISGFVYAILFQNNACTGGTDIVARYVSKKNPRRNFFWITFALNGIVAFSSYFVYVQNVNGVLVYNMKPVCLCLLYCFVSSFIGTMLMKENRAASAFIVVTKHPDEIEWLIIHQMHHTATRLSASGAYSGDAYSVLLCVVNKHQSVDLLQMVRCFPDTFLFEQSVCNTAGNFKKIK